jgi:hypothetical protein
MHFLDAMTAALEDAVLEVRNMAVEGGLKGLFGEGVDQVLEILPRICTGFLGG